MPFSLCVPPFPPYLPSPPPFLPPRLLPSCLCLSLSLCVSLSLMPNFSKFGHGVVLLSSRTVLSK